MNIFSSLIFFDHKISESVIYSRSDFFDRVFFFITKIGNWQVIIGLFIFISILFWIYKRKNLISPLFFTLVGSGVMTVVIKFAVGRARPGLDLALYIEKLSSFPSAHTALASAFFGLLIYYSWRSNLSLTVKIVSSFVFFLIITLVGFSRIYLGVHFLSDVVAGFLTGLMWVFIGMYISRLAGPVLNHNRL